MSDFVQEECIQVKKVKDMREKEEEEEEKAIASEERQVNRSLNSEEVYPHRQHLLLWEQQEESLPWTQGSGGAS